MKHVSLFLLFSMMILISVSCQPKKSKRSSAAANPLSAHCALYPTSYGCPGYTGGTAGGTTTGNPYCTQNPRAYGCPGYPGGTTSGGTGNPYPNYPSNYVSVNWGVKYPWVPTGTCSAAYTPAGVNFTPYETRKATMTIKGKTFYSPASYEAPNYLNTTSRLKSVNEAKILFGTDSMLKVRFKPLVQPESSQSNPVCYGRVPNQSWIAGYTKLQFNVRLIGFRADNSQGEESLGTQTVGVDNCSPALDLSSYASMFPNGIYLIVEGVRGNQGVWPPQYEYDTVGFKNINAMSDVRSSDCWAIDVEVAADGTKTFD